MKVAFGKLDAECYSGKATSEMKAQSLEQFHKTKVAIVAVVQCDDIKTCVIFLVVDFLCVVIL